MCTQANTEGIQDKTAMHAAAWKNHAAIVTYLAESGAEIDPVDKVSG